ncbi:MAG: hypothetical protein OSA51_13765, partial [Octadecabacter sp.]|nr:hypothetical protein [Octadecabacter sp.]
MTVFSRIFLILTLIIGGATSTFATCAPDTQFTQSDFEGFGIARAQLGLRAAFSTGPVVGLADGTLGPITQDAMHELCVQVPRPAGLDDKQSTLDVLVEFIELADVLGVQRLQDFDFDTTTPGSQALALATVPSITGRTLRGDTTAFDCSDLDSALDGSAIAQRTLATLGRIFDDMSSNQICALFPAPNDGTELRATFERLGHIAATRSGAIDILASPDFRTWVIEDQPNRLRRLVANQAAVIALIDEYNTAQPGSTAYINSSCSPIHVERSTSFYSLTVADIANIKLQISLTPVLDSFAKTNPVYDSAGALWRDLEPVLQSELSNCILTEIEPLVIGAEQLPKSYGFRPGAANQLSADLALADAKDILTNFESLRFPSKSEFLASLKSALTIAQAASVDEIIAVAADTMAAAAVIGQPPFDTSRVVIPKEEQLTLTDVPQLIVTGAADDAVQSLIDDSNLTSALEGTIITPVPVLEQIKTQVRNSLQPAAQARVTATVETQIALAEPFVLASWTMSQPLIDAIRAVPYVRAAIEDETGDDLEARLLPLVGIEYPTYRLFAKALNTISFENGTNPFSDFVLEQISMIALKTVPSPQVIREFGPISIENCACIADRGNDNLRIYGFYPFWHAPLPSNYQPDGVAVEPLRLINFAETTDIAFYGLEFTFDTRVDGTTGIVLHNAAQWRAARRDFVNSAHQHRTRVDLAFDMRNWIQWDQAAVDDVVNHITTEIAPYDVFSNYSLASIQASIPAMFDQNQADGITLIFPDYDGDDLTAEKASQLTHIIKSIYEGLPNRANLEINVAFDFALLALSSDVKGQNSEPLWQETKPLLDFLENLLIKQPYVVTTDPNAQQTEAFAPSTRVDDKVIDNLLLFLELPTSISKKILRLRIERSDFRGTNREAVLRSIIPVIPPGGHKLIHEAPRPDAAP